MILSDNLNSFPTNVVIGNISNNPIKKLIDNDCFLEGLTYYQVTNKKPQQRTVSKLNMLFENIKKLRIKDDGLSTDKLGVYCFVAKTDCSLSLKELFLPFLSLNYKDELILSGTPKINIFLGDSFGYWDEIICFKKGEVVYVGETKNLHSRIASHFSSGSGAPNSMKFGDRCVLKNNISIYYLETDIASKIEKYIHKHYGSRFGK